MRIDVFPTFDDAGEDLVQCIERECYHQRLADVDVRAMRARWRKGGHKELLRSLAFADAVVLDLTPGSRKVHRYHFAPQLYFEPDHLLQVSRSYFAQNLRNPRRKGGGSRYPHKKSNFEIAQWIVQQLVGPNRIADRQKGWLPAIGDFVDRISAPTSVQRSDVFISYRANDYADASRLKRRYIGLRKSVSLFEPGDLAHPHAVLPIWLRWQVLAEIGQDIEGCSEFVVVDSPAYRESWFTQGEVLLCAFHEVQYVSKFDPQRNQIVQVALDDLMTPISTDDWLKIFNMLHFFDGLWDMENLAAYDLFLDPGWASSIDDVTENKHWRNPLLQCPNCSTSGSHPRKINAAAFFRNQHPRLYPVSEIELERHYIEGRLLECPSRHCEQLFKIEKLPPYYLHYPLPVNEDFTFLKEVPSYAAVPVVSARVSPLLRWPVSD